MSDSEILLDYHGPIDLKVIESLLKKLKKEKEFTASDITTRKRMYGLVVECLENIYKHSELQFSDNPAIHSRISVVRENDRFIIKAGNPVPIEAKENLVSRLDHINKSDETVLKALFDNKINSDLKSDEKCAGLGFIYMALKSGNKIGYSFQPLINGYSYFEIKILLNKYHMRKLIIEKTSSSPKVILDPEKKIYLISGESRPADVREFYDQILSWLQEFSLYLLNAANKQDPVVFNFDFEYFNSSSGKLILDICKVLASLRLKGINIIVKWYHEKEDGDMLEVGKEMSRIVRFPFEYIESDIN